MVWLSVTRESQLVVCLTPNLSYTAHCLSREKQARSTFAHNHKPNHVLALGSVAAAGGVNYL